MCRPNLWHPRRNGVGGPEPGGLQRSGLVRPRRADDPSLFWNSEISSDAEVPVLLDERLLLLEQVHRRVELRLCELVRIGDPEVGLVFDRYSAASAIWIGLSGTVTLPEFCLS